MACRTTSVCDSLPAAPLLLSSRQPGRPAAPRPPAEAAEDPGLGTPGAAAGPAGSCSLQPAGAGARGRVRTTTPRRTRGGGDARGRRRRGVREGVPARAPTVTEKPPALLLGRAQARLCARRGRRARLHRTECSTRRQKAAATSADLSTRWGRGAEQRAPGLEGAGLLGRLGAETLAPRRPPRTGLVRTGQSGPRRRCAELTATPPRGRGRDPRRKCVTLASALRGAVLRGSARRRRPLPWRRRLRRAEAGLRRSELRRPRHGLL